MSGTPANSVFDNPAQPVTVAGDGITSQAEGFKQAKKDYEDAQRAVDEANLAENGAALSEAEKKKKEAFERMTQHAEQLKAFQDSKGSAQKVGDALTKQDLAMAEELRAMGRQNAAADAAEKNGQPGLARELRETADNLKTHVENTLEGQTSPQSLFDESSIFKGQDRNVYETRMGNHFDRAAEDSGLQAKSGAPRKYDQLDSAELAKLETPNSSQGQGFSQESPPPPSTNERRAPQTEATGPSTSETPQLAKGGEIGPTTPAEVEVPKPDYDPPGIKKSDLKKIEHAAESVGYNPTASRMPWETKEEASARARQAREIEKNPNLTAVEKDRLLDKIDHEVRTRAQAELDKAWRSSPENTPGRAEGLEKIASMQRENLSPEVMDRLLRAASIDESHLDLTPTEQTVKNIAGQSAADALRLNRLMSVGDPSPDNPYNPMVKYTERGQTFEVPKEHFQKYSTIYRDQNSSLVLGNGARAKYDLAASNAAGTPTYLWTTPQTNTTFAYRPYSPTSTGTMIANTYRAPSPNRGFRELPATRGIRQ